MPRQDFAVAVSNGTSMNVQTVGAVRDADRAEPTVGSAPTP